MASLLNAAGGRHRPSASALEVAAACAEFGVTEIRRLDRVGPSLPKAMGPPTWPRPGPPREYKGAREQKLRPYST